MTIFNGVAPVGGMQAAQVGQITPNVIINPHLTAAHPAGAYHPQGQLGQVTRVTVPANGRAYHASRFGLSSDDHMNEPPGDALYPHSFFDTGFMRPTGPALFHITVWQHCRKMWTDEPVGKEVYIADPNHRWNGVLLFRSAKARHGFRRWWTRYTKLFEQSLPHQNYLPVLKPGKIAGVVVTHRTKLDTAALPLTPDLLVDENSLFDGLADILQPWCWIVHHCHKPVWRVPGGWLFSRQREAAAFVLCDKGKDLGPIPSRD